MANPEAKSNTNSPGEKRISFRFKYIILPICVLLLSVAFTLYFFRLMPDEIAYRFTLEGEPDGLAGRGLIISLLLGAQLLIVLIAWGITLITSRLRFLYQQSSSLWLKPNRLPLVMGNMLFIPQLILSFTLLDILSYNAYESHIMPLWLFIVIVATIGAIVLGIILVPVVLKAFREMMSQQSEIKKE